MSFATTMCTGFVYLPTLYHCKLQLKCMIKTYMAGPCYNIMLLSVYVCVHQVTGMDHHI